jgi:hypothetical protein
MRAVVVLLRAPAQGRPRKSEGPTPRCTDINTIIFPGIRKLEMRKSRIKRVCCNFAPWCTVILKDEFCAELPPYRSPPCEISGLALMMEVIFSSETLESTMRRQNTPDQHCKKPHNRRLVCVVLCSIWGFHGMKFGLWLPGSCAGQDVFFFLPLNSHRLTSFLAFIIFLTQSYT